MNSINSWDQQQHSCQDIIHVFRKDFKKDLDCRDIEEFLRSILKKTEVDDIVKSPPNEQTYRLLWILRDQQKEIVEMFVKGLKDAEDLNYGFLMSAIQNECRIPTDRTKKYISAVDRLYNDNHKFTKYNVPRIKPFLELELALLKLRPAQNVVVEGVLGAGKQWLVLDVCSSFDVQLKMNFKIFWLNVRECCTPEVCLQMLQLFLYQISPKGHSNVDQSVHTRVRIEVLKTELQHLLKEKPYQNCLLVLRNVKNKETWEAFNLGCKILLTTGYKSVASFLSAQTTTHITLKDALTKSETESLCAKYLTEKPKLLKELKAKLPKHQITNPLHLGIIVKSISNDICTIDNFKHVRYIELTEKIKKSLSVLDFNERQLYEALFIFPKSAHIPIGLLGLVWTSENPMIIVNKFCKYSLVNKDSNNLTITLPGIYSELNLPVKNEAELNRIIINYYNIHLQFDQYNDMTLPHLDSYFYSHIGHHLIKLSNSTDRSNLFRKIFLDFRFLDKKIRNETTPRNARGSVLPTLQTLKLYKAHIDNDELIDALLDFLPNVEEQLIKSKYSNLLQIALMADKGAVFEEALRQAQRYSKYVWFTNRGRFHQHRRIINLGKDQVQRVVYLYGDYCLMALNTKQILLTDVSLEGDTTYLLSDTNNPSDIIEMRVFNTQMHLLTLHSNGSLKLWSLRELLRRPNNPTNSLGYDQVVNRVINRSHSIQNILSFFLHEKFMDGRTTHIQLHVAYNNGDICIYDWETKREQFKQSCTPMLKTQQLKLRCFSLILDRFYVLCTANCKLTVWNLNRQSKDQELEFPNNEALSMESYNDRLNNGNLCIVLLICKSSVKRFTFQQTDDNSINEPDTSTLPSLERLSLSITCSKLSKDGRYLVLGTQDVGLIVYDLKFSDYVLISNVREQIICLDVYDLKHPIYKYIVLCGAAGTNFLHLYMLRNVAGDHNHAITWVHSAQSVDNISDTNVHLEPNVHLRPLLKMSSNGTLFSVDSKSRIHQIQTAVGEEFGRRHCAAYWSTIPTPQLGFATHITALYPCNDNAIYAGYNNGIIYNISDEKRISQNYITEQIDYLKVVNLRTLIASTRNARKTLIYLMPRVEGNKTREPIWWSEYTIYARLFDEHFLLLFSKKALSHLDSPNSKLQIIEEPEEDLVGFDLKNKLLFLGLRDGIIKIYKLDKTGDQLNIKQLCIENINSQSLIKYLTVSNDGKMLFLGLSNGQIKLYTFNDRLSHIYTIKQGHEPGHEMKLRFSPCLQILVSCGDQLCFWSVRHMLNNQSQAQIHPKGCEEVDASPCSDQSVEQKYVMPSAGIVRDTETHFWKDKRGHATLPELLSSIKFVGNKARNFYTNAEFTQFHVLDDGGVFYDLNVLEKYLSESYKESIAIASSRHLEALGPFVSNVNGDDNAGIDVAGNAHSESLSSASNLYDQLNRR
ncbi:GH23155 [Drosophila grimshawi]|uniref:GH23155 n=1 Tax=Drosophila grimshawi TaxID=7222 RepID=B4JVN7_DROGR|nr:GH23155 [Drosophila grimshawi]